MYVCIMIYREPVTGLSDKRTKYITNLAPSSPRPTLTAQQVGERGEYYYVLFIFQSYNINGCVPTNTYKDSVSS